MKNNEVLKTEEAMIEIQSYGLTRIVKSSIIVNTSLNKAWEELTNFKRWEEWNSFIPSVIGDFKPNQKISIIVKTPGQKPSNFKPTVYEIKEQEKISWGGKAVYVGFEGVHDFLLQEIDDQKVKFTQIEMFKGPVVLFMGKMLGNIAEGYRNMNYEFKKHLEENLIN